MTPDELAKHGLRVKPLAWEPDEAWKRCTRERAPAFGGEYQIVMLDLGEDELPSLYFEIGLGAFLFRFEQAPDPIFPDMTGPRKFASVDLAKAAGQADYERRIFAALEPIAPPDDADLIADDLELFGDEILLHGQPGKRSAAPPDVAQAARVLLDALNTDYAAVDKGCYAAQATHGECSAGEADDIVEAFLRAIAEGGDNA